MPLLDASVLIRYVTGDDPVKARRCEHLLNEVAQGVRAMTMTSLCVAEIAWVLDRHYRYPRAAIITVMRRLLQTDGLVVAERDIWLAALDLYEVHTMSLIDAYHVAFLHAHDLDAVYSYDADFDHVPGLTRREP